MKETSMSIKNAIIIVRDGDELWCTCSHQENNNGHSEDCYYLTALTKLLSSKRKSMKEIEQLINSNKEAS